MNKYGFSKIKKVKVFFLTSVILIFIFKSNVCAQNKTYFGFEAAITNDVYEISDNGSDLKSVRIVEGFWGFNFRQDINNYLFLEIGLIRNYYDEGFGFKTTGSIGSTDAMKAWIIPLRLGTKINLCNRKIFLVPVIGYSFCISPDHPSRKSGSGYIKANNDSVSFNFSSYAGLTRHFTLLQTGIGFEFKLFNTAILSINTNYYTGFQKIIQLDINYKSNNLPQMTGHGFSKGEFWNLGVGLKYPISSFWKKKS